MDSLGWAGYNHTRKGKVVYKRKKHPFTLRRIYNIFLGLDIDKNLSENSKDDEFVLTRAMWRLATIRYKEAGGLETLEIPTQWTRSKDSIYMALSLITNTALEFIPDHPIFLPAKQILGLSKFIQETVAEFYEPKNNK